MMRMRKIAAALAAVSMLAVCSAQVVSAADTVTITAEEVKAVAGADFTLDVKLEGVPSAGLNAADFAVTYDASAITITDVSAGDILNAGASEKEGMGVDVLNVDFSEAGEILVTYTVAVDDSSYWVTKDGTFLTISGKVNDGTADGTYKVNVTAIDRETYEGSGTPNTEIYLGSMDADGVLTQYTAKAKAGAVIVGDGGEVTTGMRGDADCDGKIDILDVISINRSLVGKEQLTAQGKINADLNGDGIPDANDSMTILRWIVRLIDEL